MAEPATSTLTGFPKGQRFGKFPSGVTCGQVIRPFVPSVASMRFHVRPRDFSKGRHLVPQRLHVGDQLPVRFGLPHPAGKVPGVGGICSDDSGFFTAFDEQPAQRCCKPTEFGRVVGAHFGTDEPVLLGVGDDRPCFFVMEFARAFTQARITDDHDQSPRRWR